MRRAALALAAIALLIVPAAATAAAQTRASFTQIEDEVMCVLCHEPLALAQSPEAFQERDYIRGLILQGKTRRQIEHDLVEQYGPAVLAKPPAHGFNLLVWVIPPVAIVLAVLGLAIALPRWRRRSRQDAGGTAGHASAALTTEDAQRLDADLAVHDV